MSMPVDGETGWIYNLLCVTDFLPKADSLTQRGPLSCKSTMPGWWGRGFGKYQIWSLGKHVDGRRGNGSPATAHVGHSCFIHVGHFITWKGWLHATVQCQDQGNCENHGIGLFLKLSIEQEDYHALVRVTWSWLPFNECTELTNSLSQDNETTATWYMWWIG